MAAIRHSQQARRDLIDIWISIAEHDPAAADRMLERLEARVDILTRYPHAGAVRSEIVPDAGVLVERPYLILYRVPPEGVQIVRVLHGARDIDDALFNEGLAEDGSHA